MSPIVTALIIYLACGLLFIAGLCLFTPKIRQEIKDAPYELFNRLFQRESYISLTLVKLIMYPAIWLFWVFIIVGMVRGKYERNHGKH